MRRRPALRFRIGSTSGLRSQIWSIAADEVVDPVLGRCATVSIDPEPGSCPTAHIGTCGSWAVRVPDDTAAVHELADPAAAPELGRLLDAPAPGWQVGAVLLVPTVALSCRPDGTGDGVTLVPAPEQGLCTRITVLLGKPHRSRTTAADDPAVRTGRLLASDGSVQVWRGQTALAPEMSRYIVWSRQRLVEVAPVEPRTLPAFSRFRGRNGIDVIIDLGLV